MEWYLLPQLLSYLVEETYILTSIYKLEAVLDTTFFIL